MIRQVAGVLVIFRIARLHDRVLPLRPAHEIHLPAAHAAERAMPRQHIIGRQLTTTNGATRGIHEDFSLDDFAVDLLDDSPPDFDSAFVDSDLDSPPEVGLVSAAALFLYESLR